MDALNRHDWYLFDYGMVITFAPPAAGWAALREAAGLDLEAEGSGYWAHRAAFDDGALDSAAYWGLALGRAVGVAEAEELDRLDAAQWSHHNPDTLAVLDALHARGGSLALLSNMPVRMSELLEAESTWVRYFDTLLFSGRLRLSKPDARIFQHALREMGTDAGRVVFVDDKAENIHAARALGFRTVHHVPGVDLAAELGL